MSDDSGSNASTTKGGDSTDNDHHGGSEGHKSDIPADSPASESEVSLSQQVADRETDGGDE